MSVPNQLGYAQPYIFTTVAPDGAPGPASEFSDASVRVFLPGQASTGQQGSADSDPVFDSEVVGVPHDEQYLGELISTEGGFEVPGTAVDILASQNTGAPTPGQVPTPEPAVSAFNEAGEKVPSNGQQPSVATAFTGPGWVAD